MRDKIWAFLLVILAILNLVFDLISPPVHLYRNLIEADIGFLVFSIVLILMWRILNDR